MKRELTVESVKEIVEETKINFERKNGKNTIIPYRSIDIIFNKNNMFLNVQKVYNPVKCNYNIYDLASWLPILKENDDMPVWRTNVPSFYSFKNYVNYYTSEEKLGIEKKIESEVNIAIKEVRQSKNLLTVLKKQSREMMDLMIIYMIYCEALESGNLEEEEFKRRIDCWREAVKKKMPDATQFAVLPVKVNFINETQIAYKVRKECEDYLLEAKKSCAFFSQAKVFEYPNKIVSNRIVICCIRKVSRKQKLQSDDWVYFPLEENIAVSEEG